MRPTSGCGSRSRRQPREPDGHLPQDKKGAPTGALFMLPVTKHFDFTFRQRASGNAFEPTARGSVSRFNEKSKCSMPAKFFRDMSGGLWVTMRQTGRPVRRSRGALRAGFHARVLCSDVAGGLDAARRFIPPPTHDEMLPQPPEPEPPRSGPIKIAARSPAARARARRSPAPRSYPCGPARRSCRRGSAAVRQRVSHSWNRTA